MSTNSVYLLSCVEKEIMANFQFYFMFQYLFMVFSVWLNCLKLIRLTIIKWKQIYRNSCWGKIIFVLCTILFEYHFYSSFIFCRIFSITKVEKTTHTTKIFSFFCKFLPGWHKLVKDAVKIHKFTSCAVFHNHTKKFWL